MNKRKLLYLLGTSVLILSIGIPSLLIRSNNFKESFEPSLTLSNNLQIHTENVKDKPSTFYLLKNFPPKGTKAVFNLSSPHSSVNNTSLKIIADFTELSLLKNAEVVYRRTLSKKLNNDIYVYVNKNSGGKNNIYYVEASSNSIRISRDKTTNIVPKVFPLRKNMVTILYVPDYSKAFPNDKTKTQYHASQCLNSITFSPDSFSYLPLFYMCPFIKELTQVQTPYRIDQEVIGKDLKVKFISTNLKIWKDLGVYDKPENVIASYASVPINTKPESAILFKNFIPSIIPAEVEEEKVVPTPVPSVVPTIAPTIAPTVAPTVAPSITPSVEPSDQPTEEPSASPDSSPEKCTELKNKMNLYQEVLTARLKMVSDMNQGILKLEDEIKALEFELIFLNAQDEDQKNAEINARIAELPGLIQKEKERLKEMQESKENIDAATRTDFEAFVEAQKAYKDCLDGK